MQSLKNGTVLGGYTLIRMIARGGMGEVYEAYEAKLQRKVALKVIAPTNPDEHDRDDLIRRFMQEARTLARVNHPNVVTIYSIDNVNRTPFIAMEYVDGVSFRQLLEELTFTVDGALPLFLQMLEGLKSLHDNRIIHRDLKPHNILLRPDGQIKILDFGIAKHVGQHEHTRAGVIVGTLPYMSPELKNGSPASMRSDLWSLGAIFFEILAGKRLVECIPDRDIEYPEDAGIPEEFRAILNKMCAHKQSDRYLVAEQVIEDIRNFQQSRPPVPASVWNNLAKKVEAMAEGLRKRQDMEIPPSSPRNLRATEMIKNGRIENSQDAPTRVAPQMQHKRAKTQVKQNSFSRGWTFAGLASILVIVGVIVMNDGDKKPTADRNLQSSSDKLALKEPADGQVVWLEPTRLPTLSWTKPLNPNKYDIQISTDANFKKILVQEPVAGFSFRPERVLAEGSYHWRLSPKKESEPVIGPGTFTVSLLTPVELVSPENHRKVDAGGAARAELDFKWACKPGAKLYVVQIGDDPEFRNNAQEKMLTTCEWKGAMLVPGQYYWRARLADVAAANTLWSPTRTLTIKLGEGGGKSAAPVTVTPPVRPARTAAAPAAAASSGPLAEPKPKRALTTHSLVFTGKPRDLASLNRSVTQLPVLEWRPVKGATKYSIQFSASRDFDQLIGEDTSTRPSLEWRSVVPGRTFWRVSAHGNGGEQSEYSSAAQILVLLPAPQIDSTYKFVITPGASNPEQVHVEWQASPLVGKYLVQMGPSRDLAGAYERVNKGNRLPLPNQPGQNYVRVAAANENGEAISAYSNIASVEIAAAFAMEAPKLMSPKSGARAPSKNGRISVVFAWGKVNNAESYVFEIAGDPEFQNIIERRDSKNRGTLLQQAELSGRVYWRVKAVSPSGASDWSTPFFFDVK